MKSDNLPLMTKILVVQTVLVFICIIFVTDVSNLLNKENAHHINEISERTAIILTNRIKYDIQTLEVLANLISNFECINCENVIKAIQTSISEKNFRQIDVFLPDGSNIFDESEEVSYESYFLQAMEGISDVTEVKREDDNGNILVFALPIKKNNSVVGVLRAKYPVYELSEILNTKPTEMDGYTVVIKNTGDVILYSKEKSANLLYNNIYKYIESFPNNNQQIEKFYNDIQEGKTNSIILNKDNNLKYISYIPVEYISGCYLLTIEPYDILSKNAYSVVKNFIIVFVIVILLSIIVIIYINNAQNKSKKTIEKLAFEDRITGGMNINKFIIEAKNILIRNKTEKFCLVKLDIDKFKYYNDTHGFEIGNQMLKHVYNRINFSMLKDEIIARESGDNFIIMMKYVDEINISERLNKMCSKQINLSEFCGELNTSYVLDLSFGVYIIEDIDTDINLMIDRANIALKKSKDSRFEKIYFYDEGLRNTIIKEKELENIMHASLENNEFVVHLQPKYNICLNKVVGAEALVRWNHPEKGMLYPGDFIALFEKNGFIVNIDMFMLESICKIIKGWIEEGYKPVPISLNMSIINFNSEDFAYKLESVIKKYGVPVHLIEIELVETMVCDDVDRFIKIINKLKEIGICISMDDFGTGYSSLNLLKDMPIDVIKLDRGFFNESTYTNKGETIVASIVKMAEDLGLKVICEGIETDKQLNFVKKVGCHIVQGYLLSKPVTVEKFEKIAF